MSSTPIKITTVDRILDASLKLFNEHGFHCVPAMRIAEHLSISPGHLAYHFKNKSDIMILDPSSDFFRYLKSPTGKPAR